MRGVIVGALACLLVACGSSSSNTCVAGASLACTCANGSSGAQVCASDGTLGACACASGTGMGGGTGNGGTTGAGGTTGSGGSTGHGGTVGTGGATNIGGATGTGGATGMGGSGSPSTAQFTVMYAGGPTSDLTICYSCMGWYYAAPRNEGDMTFGMSSPGGGTTLSMAVRPAAAGGNEMNVGLTENNTSLAAQYQGDYNLGGAANVWVPVQGSCVTFNTLSLQLGGGASGSLSCMLPGGNGTAPITATVTGTFSATF